jgi:hypothetical protein
MVINPKYESLRGWIDEIPERFELEGRTVYSGRNLIKVFELDGRQINVKRYRKPHLLNRIVYSFFRPSKAKRSFRYAFLLDSKGIATPEPLAYIITKRCGLIDYSFLITLQVDYRHTMYEFGKGGVEGREHIVEALARFTAQLHEAGVYHKDYSPGNILFNETPDFCIIDINRMRFAPVSVRRGCANFARLWGQKPMFCLLASSYAKARKADEQDCLRWILHDRAKFWKQYRRKRELTFEFE